MRKFLGGLLLVGCTSTATPVVTEPTTKSTTPKIQVEIPVQSTSPKQTVRLVPKEVLTEKTLRRLALRHDYPCGDYLAVSIEAGWPIELWPQQSFVMWRESRCRPEVRSTTSDTGLMQINDYWCEPSKYSDAGWLQDQGIVSTCEDLKDPETNVRAALAIFTYSLERNQNGWNPWRMAADFEPPAVAD